MTESNDDGASGANQPGPGHNVAEDAVVAVNLSKIRVAQEKSTSASGDLRSVLSHAEGKGLDIAAAKAALKIARSGDAEKFIATTQKTLAYLRILGHGVPKQKIDLFEYVSELAPIDEKARDAGRNAGLLGEPEGTNPHDPSTPAGQAWLGAYRQGWSEREAILAMAPDDDDDGDGDSTLIAAPPQPEQSSGEPPGPGGFNDDLEEPPPSDGEEEESAPSLH